MTPTKQTSASSVQDQEEKKPKPVRSGFTDQPASANPDLMAFEAQLMAKAGKKNLAENTVTVISSQDATSA